jgi:hypothetical protein
LARSIGFGTVLLFLVTGAYGQGRAQRMSPEQRAQRQMAADSALVKELAIEGELASKVFATLGEANDKQQALMAEMRASGSRDGFQSMRAQMDEIRQETDGKIKALLTEEQFVKYQEIRKKQDEMRRQGRRRGGPDLGNF